MFSKPLVQQGVYYFNQDVVATMEANITKFGS